MTAMLITDRQLAAIRAIGESGMQVDVIIKHRLPFADVGDDTVRHDTDYADHHCKGWLMNIVGRSLTLDPVMVVNDSNFTLRIPVGIPIDTHDIVWIADEKYEVMDSNIGESYRVWNIAALMKLS
jgi:hypothetical protein